MRKSRWGELKRLRVAVSLVIVCASSVCFLDIWHVIPRGVIPAVLSLQIIPAVLTVLTGFSAAALAGGCIIVLLTLLWGRVYCSAICPLGFLQDLIIRIRRRLNRRKRYIYHPPLYLLHYGLTGAAVVIALATGSLLLINCFEPYSNFGRLLTGGLQPALIYLNNTGARLFMMMHLYSLHTIQYPWSTAGTLGFMLLFLSLLVVLTFTRGRLFCNTLCPAGAFLGILSRRSIYRLGIDEGSCNECGACEKVCKAECIDSDAKRIDMAACVGCFNCIRSCPHGSIGYARARREPLTAGVPEYSPSRRSFFGSLRLPAAGVILPMLLPPLPVKPVKPATPVTPPGSGGTRHFTGTCTACHLCVTICPTHVLTPALFEYGLSGVMQPKMNYASGYCNYDCTACGEVCPTGAIHRVGIDEKKLIQIGKSTFVRDDCIVVSKKKDCAACSEHCPTKAVHTVPYESGLFIPELNNDLCIGCGACEYACPTQPAKAIFVTPNPVHGIAKKPEPSQQQQKLFDQKNDFPF